MNTQLRFYRVVVAASLGAVLWAACSSPEHRMAATSPAPVSAPIDLLKRTPSTHPEQQYGFFDTEARYVEPPVQFYVTPATDIAVIRQEIREAAGAERPATLNVNDYRNELSKETCDRLGIK